MSQPPSAEAGAIGMSPLADEDYAWAAFDCPMMPADTLALLEDVELALRANPMLVFSAFEATGPQQWRIAGHNQSNDRPFETGISVQRNGGGLRIDYADGLKSHSVLALAPIGSGTRVTITDYYQRANEVERRARLDEVDRSLPAWALALRGLFVRWRRWSRIPGWRWYMLRVWKPMSPSARRITFLLIAISAFEVVTATLAVLVWRLGSE